MNIQLKMKVENGIKNVLKFSFLGAPVCSSLKVFLGCSFFCYGRKSSQAASKVADSIQVIKKKDKKIGH